MIDIAKAEKIITDTVPALKPLQGGINVKGNYLLFDHIAIANAHIDDINYIFNAYVATRSRTKDKKYIYKPLEDILNPLITAFQQTRKIQIGTIKPYVVQGLIVYQIPLTVNLYEAIDDE